MADRASGAAWRRRQRRLRSWWHHSHSKVGTANAALRGQKLGTSTEVGPAEYFELSSEDGMPTGRKRPTALLEPLPRGTLQRHAGIGYEIVQNLDVPVLQAVEQLPDVLQFFVMSVPAVAEQVSNVPKISQDRTRQRLVDHLRQPHTAQQLEVPTIISCSSLHPGQSSTAFGGAEYFPAATAEQIVDIPVPRGGRDLPSAASSSANEGFFSHFSPVGKSAKLGSHSGSELLPESSPSTRGAYAVLVAPEVAAPVLDVDSEDEDLDRWRDELGRLWMRSAVNPRKWYLLGTGRDVDIIWEEPG